ncbi:hypothetical protein [Hymenobacter sp.]|jgi:hypothetical protein|uniref:hypothetical protein n=1 Tax=Hymenobacter sp. TaxID=1898978 RepID=UPI002EDBAE02
MRCLLPRKKHFFTILFVFTSLTGYSQNNTNACAEASKVFTDLSAELKKLKERLQYTANAKNKYASLQRGRPMAKNILLDSITLQSNLYRNLQLIDRAISNTEFLRNLVDVFGMRVSVAYAANVECSTATVATVTTALVRYQDDQIIKRGVGSVLGSEFADLVVKVSNYTTNPQAPFDPIKVTVRIPRSSWDGKSGYQIWYAKAGCDPVTFSRHCEARVRPDGSLIAPPSVTQSGLLPGVYKFWCVSTTSGKVGRVEEKTVGGADQGPIDLTPPR